MASVLSSHALQPGAATDRLLDSFGLAERDGFIEEAGAAVAFSTVFLQDDADHDEGHELMLQRLQAAIAGAGASAASSGATTAHASSSASSDSGVDAHGDDKDACKWIVATVWGRWTLCIHVRGGCSGVAGVPAGSTKPVGRPLTCARASQHVEEHF